MYIVPLNSIIDAYGHKDQQNFTREDVIKLMRATVEIIKLGLTTSDDIEDLLSDLESKTRK